MPLTFKPSPNTGGIEMYIDKSMFIHSPRHQHFNSFTCNVLVQQNAFPTEI